MPAMQQPEAYVGQAGTLFDAAGNIANEGTLQFFQGFMDAFAAWIRRNTG
jgi:chromate reductase